MPVTPIFAAIFSLLYIVLSLGVIHHRRKKKIAYGDGGDRQLNVAIRVHGNFAEYVPLSLLLLWFLETVAYEASLTFVLACILLVARLVHVVGMRDPKNYLLFRQLGVLGTFGVILVSAIRLIWQYTPI